MKKIFLFLKNLFVEFFNKKNSETKKDDTHGDFVPLVWKIEKMRRREGGCTMNELITEVKKDFKGLENIKHRHIDYK